MKHLARFLIIPLWAALSCADAGSEEPNGGEGGSGGLAQPGGGGQGPSATQPPSSIPVPSDSMTSGPQPPASGGAGGADSGGQPTVPNTAGSAAGGLGGGGGSPSGGGAAGEDGASGGGAGGSPAPIYGIEARPLNQTCLPPPARDQAAALLSETGCVDPANPTQPAKTLIPYDVASPLWSDGAAKTRYFALPDDGVITIKDCAATPAACDPEDPAYTTTDDGDWTVPDGSVLVKTFALGGRLIETRLLVRIDEFNWWGYSYQWREDQSDADLLAANSDGYFVDIDTPDGVQTWHYPSRNHCLQCHTDAAGRDLGLETSQLNFDYTYPNGVTANQMQTLTRIGVFDTASEPVALEPYVLPSNAEFDLDQRARSYLHANCANCHRPGGESTDIDLRNGIELGDMGICDVMPSKGDLGVPGAMILSPGDPSMSVLSLRIHTLDVDDRMPRVGTTIVDPVGTEVVDGWISSLSGCPE